FVGKGDVTLGLDDLEREAHVVGARDAGHVALDLRVELHTIFEILLLPGGGFHRVGNFAAFDDALSGWHGCNGSELIEGASCSAVVADVPIGCAEGLPEAGEVGFAVGHTGDLLGGAGGGLGYCRRCDDKRYDSVENASADRHCGYLPEGATPRRMICNS